MSGIERPFRGSARPLDQRDWGVSITDVDCTPRPRYGESRADFEVRMRSYSVQHEAVRRDVNLRNRVAALKGPVFVGEIRHWFTQCACGWCGLQVTDPEVARREFDAHACAVNGDAPVVRAMAEVDSLTLEKRHEPTVRPADELRQLVAEALGVPVEATTRTQVEADNERFALLELK